MFRVVESSDRAVRRSLNSSQSDPQQTRFDDHNVLRLCRGTTSWRRLVERRCRRASMSERGMQYSASGIGKPCREGSYAPLTRAPELVCHSLRHVQPMKVDMHKLRACDRPRSSFLVPLTRRVEPHSGDAVTCRLLRPPLGKKRRVLRSSRLCYQDRWQWHRPSR